MSDSQAKPRLVLIDGHALAYRQFHGLPLDSFITVSGEPTNATWGVARTLLDILQSPTPPEYLAMTFDQGLSGREIAYSGYKANRDEMADAMAVQLVRIRELVQAFNIPILEKEGFEADDVIGTVARQASAQGVNVHIVTGDRDLMQLVDEHVTIEMPPLRGQARRGSGSTGEIYNVARVNERFGVRPDQYVDFKGFVGDPSDNIPGVRGIGEKTAAQLLQKYGTLEGVYEHLGEIKGSQHDKLEQGRDNAFLSRDLSRIKRDVAVDFDLTRCVAHDYDPETVARLFKILEFRHLATRLPGAQKEPNGSGDAQSSVGTGQQMNLFDTGEANPAGYPAPQQILEIVNTIVVNSSDTLAALVQTLEAAQGIAFDTETTGTNQMEAQIVGISLAVNGETGYYIPVGHQTPAGGDPPQQLPLETVIAAIKPAMTNPEIAKYAHNADYDMIILRRCGLDVQPIGFDTMIAEFLNNPDSRRKGLKDQAEDRLNVQMTHIEELIGKGKNQITMDRVPVSLVAPYAAADAAMTYRLVEPLREVLAAPFEGNPTRLLSIYTDIEMPLIPVLVDMEMSGIKLDLPYLAELNQEFTKRLDEIQEKIFELASGPFNIGSPKQLNDVLFVRLGLPTTGLSKSAHGFSVDADALEALSQHHEIAARIVEWRGLDKLKSTYVDSLPTQVDPQGRIHTSYNQIGAVTGRISSDSPNLQNIPIRTEEGRRVRKAFIAPPGRCLVSVDYSQVELRILGHFSGDPFLREAFANNQDIHKATAAAVMNIPLDEVTKEQRYFAKRVNFGLMYGMGAQRLARESGMAKKEADQFIERYFERFPGVKGYFEGSKRFAEQHGYLETLLGRRRYFPSLRSKAAGQQAHMQRARAEREAINMPIQGTAADIIKIAMINLSKRLKAELPRAAMILQVHDELVFEVPDDEVNPMAALAREVMENALKLDVPLRAEANYGNNWSEMEPVNE